MAGDGQVTISFTAPLNNGGSEITEYHVIPSEGAQVTGSSSPIVVSGLTNGKSYTFTVVAINAIGSSLQSANSNPVAPTAPSIEPIRSTNGKIKIPVGRAGEVSLDQAIFIQIPAHASKKQLEIDSTQVPNKDKDKLIDKKQILASHSVYEVSMNIHGKLSKPATLTMVFDPMKVSSKQTVAIFYYNASKKEWARIEGGIIVGNHISVEVTSFAKFAVLVVDKDKGKDKDKDKG